MERQKTAGVVEQVAATGLTTGLLAGVAAFAWVCLSERFFHLRPILMIFSLTSALNITIPLSLFAAVFCVTVPKALPRKPRRKYISGAFLLAVTLSVYFYAVRKAAWGDFAPGAGAAVMATVLALSQGLLLFAPSRKPALRRSLPLCALILFIALNAISHFLPRQPNIVLVTLDTTRADSLRLYGGPAATPALEALAKRGYLFEHALAPSQCTNPSHASILTGLYPRTHMVYDNNTSLAGEARTLPERLSEDGYLTLAAVAARHLNPDNSGFGQGFMRFLECDPFELDAGECNRKLIPVLGKLLNHPQPFFLWVHYYDPHGPYRDRPSTAPPGPPSKVPWQGFMNVPEPPDGLVDVSEQRRRYAGEIEYMDAEIGRLVEFLQRSGRCDDTIIAVVGDHGEGLGEHGIYFSHAGSFRQVTRVPLIISGPGIAKGRTDRLVTTLDLYPTLLETAGLKEDSPQEGKSLLGMVRGEESASHHDFVFMEAVNGVFRSIFTPRWRYVKIFSANWSMETPYLMPADEKVEQENLLDEYPETAVDLERQIQTWLKEGPVPPLTSSKNAEDEKITEALRALGYIQ